MLLELWSRERVDTSAVIIDREAPTGAYFVTHGPRGHVFSHLRTGSAASRLRPADLPDLKNASVVHASGISMAISASASDTVLAAFEAARAGGARISFDSNLRLKLGPLARARAMISAAAAMADYFFPSIEDAHALSSLNDEDSALDWAHGLGARNAFLKLGERGVIASDGTRRRAVPASRWLR